MAETVHDVDHPPVIRGRSLREVLATPVLEGSRVLAGSAGLERTVERLNVMEVPDILPWVKPAEFLLTTAYPLHQQTHALAELVGQLDDAGLAGIGIKVGRYLDEVPADVLEIADARGFPVVELPAGVAFDDVLTEVLSGILEAQAERLARSQRIHSALLQIVLEGDGLDRITDTLSDLIGVPTAIVAPDGEVLAAGRLGPTGGDRIGLSDGSVMVDGRREPAITVPVSAGHRLHGYVVALGDPDADEGPFDRQALEHAATVAALTISKDLELVAVERRYQSELMHDLITGRLERTDDAIERGRLFGWELDRRLITVVAQLDDPPMPRAGDTTAGRIPLADTLERSVRARDPGAAIVRFTNEVVVLTAAFHGDGGKANASRFIRELAATTTAQVGASISVGLGRPVEKVLDIPRGYNQATAALRIGRKLRGRGAAVHFDDLGAYRILDLIDDPLELASFVRDVLGDLARSTPTASDLRRTLRVLIEANGNVAEAARRLHFHYNTLRYRIDKIEGVVGPFTSDASLRLDVHLALLILEMRGLDES